MEDLEGAYESALNAEGSAMRENEAYLDSIQGRIDLFTNSWQTMWMNLIESDTIKDIVDLGTSLVELADDIGVVNIAFTALAMRMSAKYFKVDFAQWFNVKNLKHPIKSIKDWFKTIEGGSTAAQNNLDALTKSYEDAKNAYELNPLDQNNLNAYNAARVNLETYQQTANEAIKASNNLKKAQENLANAQNRLNNYTGNSQKELYKLQDGVKRAQKGVEDATEATKKFEQSGSKSFANVGEKVENFVGQVQSVVASMLVMYAITKIIDLIGDAFDKNIETTEEAKQSFDDLTSELSNTKSSLKDLESELSNIEDQITEINQNSPLSFTDEEELNRLKAESEELKRQIEYTELLEKQQQLGVNQSAVNAAEKYKQTGTKTGNTASENIGSKAGSGALIGAGIGTVAVGSAAAGIGTAVLGAKAGTAIGTAIAPVIGTLIGAAVGAIAGAAVGVVVGGIQNTTEETIGETMDNMTENYNRLQSEMETARAKYIQSGNKKDQEKYEEALEAFNKYQSEMATYMTEMDSIYSQMDWDTATEEERKAMQEFYNQRDKWAITSGAQGAEVTALDRIFGENASEEIQLLKEQILDAVAVGKDFDFTSAINGSQELKSTLDYIGLSAEDVKNYFTQIGEAAASTADTSKEINPFDTYSTIIESVSEYNDILEQTAEIIADNTRVTQDYKDSIIALVGSEEEVNKYFDENNSLVVKNAKGLKNLISQNIKLAKSQHQLDYYNLVRQLNSTLNGTKQLDATTRNSIYTLLDQIDVVDRAIYQYQLLEDSLLGASNAFSEFAQAQEIDAANTYGDSYVEMAQTMYDAFYKTGQVGTEANWAAIEGLIPDSVYQGLTEDADKMQAIVDYYNNNILPTLTNDEGQLSIGFENIENFVQKGISNGIFTGDTESFDLVEGMNLEKAAELMDMTKTQAYAMFAELDKYNTSGTELSFLSQLDDSFEGRVTKITNQMEELNRQKLALLEDGGYEKNKETIDSINQQLVQCDKNLEAAGIEAYNMWQKYSKNDVALNALSAIEDKQQQITEEGATTLGLEWDEVKGQTIQQVYDELLAEQQALGAPTELTIQLAKENIEAELDELEAKLKKKGIDVEANVIWNDKDKQYEATEGSEYTNDKDLQKYINLQNEGYALDDYFESGMTATEEYLSSIESILQGIYDHQTGNDENVESTDDTKNADTSSTVNGPEFNFDGIKNFAGDVGAFFTETIPEISGDVYSTLSTFFTETVPQEWNEFWGSVGEALEPIGDGVQELYNVVSVFFTETIPQAWNEFWTGAGETLNEIGNDAVELYNVVSVFFKETIPQKWEEFWTGVGDFLTEDAPYAIGYAAGVVTRFFTVTIPEKWDEFWEGVGEFIDDVANGAEALCEAIDTFFYETIPEKWNELWENISEFYEEVINPVVEDVKTALTTFFTETIPEKWNELWDSVGEFFTTTIPTAIDSASTAINTFFTVTLPAKWSELWDSVGDFISGTIVPALTTLQSKLTTFFTQTVPEKWDELWTGVETFFTETIPGALQQLGSAIQTFFTETVPAKCDELWTGLNNAFITPISTAISTIQQGITTFFTQTVPNAINGMWSSLSSWISEQASSIFSNLRAGFTAGMGGGSVNGTAHASGTVRKSGSARANGTPHKSGSWGAPRTETSLVGELGPEILVRGNRWTTVGDNGAEFTQVRKGDIIFNHQQTEALLSKGYVTGRGKAYASGTAYAGLWKPTNPGSSGSSNRDFDSASSALSNAADNISSSADKFEETFDWIEVRLEEINEDLDLKNAKLENAIGSSNQNSIVDDIINLNQKLYENLIAGANEYYNYAAKLLTKVPKKYREAAQDGAIAIEEFAGDADEKTLEAIKEYREWVQKGADATQQAEETLTEISNLAKQAIDNIATDFENQNSIRDNKIDQLEAYNDLSEAKYGSESASIYEAIIKETKKNISALESQRDKMQAELNKQVEAGNIEKYSQNWYDAINDIAAVDTEIIELTKDTYDYQDAINELHWDNFDNLMSRFEAISDEADNLIDILGSKDLVDKDTGEWTDEGITTLGLYAQQMEVAEMQAKKYEEEIKYLNKNWKKLGYTEQEYVEKLDELKDGQYDAIKSYNDTKDAIVDLNKERVDAIKDGIQKEIDAYSELIEKKKEELDAEKDLYDFQKNIADKQKDIADIERKLAALSADNSASARAKRAQLEADLAEAQAELQEAYYDRSISDQQDALDKELENFQNEKDEELDSWDEYLENTEQVVSDSLATIQENTNVVYQTLQTMGQEYSLSIAEALTSPWKDGETAIQSYSEKFGLSMSSTVEELQKLADEFKKVMDEIEGYGDKVVGQVNKNAETYQGNNKPQDNNKEDNKEDDDKEEIKTIQVGGKINAGSAKIYDYVGDLSGNKQYYSADPIYKVLAIDGNWVQVRHKSLKSGVTGWFKKSDVKAYAKGTTSVPKDQWSLIDELGEELQLIPDGNGRLAYMKKGTGVVPADLTSNLMEWGKLDPSTMLDQNRPQIAASPSVVNNTTEIHIDNSVGELIHVERLDGNNPAELTKIVDKAWDKHMKELNAHVRRYTNR